MKQEALRQVEVEKQAQQRNKSEQRFDELQHELTQGKEKMRNHFVLYATGDVKQEKFVGFQRLHKGQVAQLGDKIIAIERQIRELGDIRGDTSYITLTEGVGNGIILQNGIEASLELLDRLIYEVRVCGDRAMENQYDFG